jgi:hypothetical protein
LGPTLARVATRQHDQGRGRPSAHPDQPNSANRRKRETGCSWAELGRRVWRHERGVIG